MCDTFFLNHDCSTESSDVYDSCSSVLSSDDDQPFQEDRIERSQYVTAAACTYGPCHFKFSSQLHAVAGRFGDFNSGGVFEDSERLGCDA